jgi:hypothetical protein
MLASNENSSLNHYDNHNSLSGGSLSQTVIECAQIIAGGGTDSGQSRNNAVSCNSNSDNMRINASAENMPGRAVTKRSNSILFDTLVLTDILFEQLQGYADYDSINSLLNASKQYESVKKAKYYWKLKRNYSLKYHAEKKFRSEVQLVLTDVNKQLSLNLDSAGGIDVSAMSGVISLMTDDRLGRNDILDLGRRYKLSNGQCFQGITDVSTIGSVHSVNLYGCEGITDVSPLRYVRFLNLSGCCEIVDVSSLRDVYSLDLSYCSKVVDVSALGNVHCLNLRSCHQIIDVRALRDVFSLNLSRCKKIRDVSMLGNVYSLHLRGCVMVTDVSALHSCHVIFLDAIQKKTIDTSALVNVNIRDR